MTIAALSPFDFAALDGLAFAAERGRLSPGTPPRMVARDLGPVIELAQLAAGGLLPAPERAAWLNLNCVGSLYRALLGGRSQWVCPDGRRIGFLKTGSSPVPEGVWTGFGLAAQQGAVAAGFPKRIGAQLAAALGELHSNLHEHSQAPETGLIAFRAGLSRFEFVGTDRGIGVRESLRSCKTYAALDDHGEALRLTLTDGVSRHGPEEGRGHGFRPLFIGLANLNGSLRFRSGDHSLVMNGRNPSLVSAQLAQKPPIQGFLISVVCEAAANRPLRD
jgi:hypothetical protein